MRKIRKNKLAIWVLSILFLLISTCSINVYGLEQEEEPIQQENDFYVVLPEIIEVSQGCFTVMEIEVYPIGEYYWNVSLIADIFTLPEGVAVEIVPDRAVPPGTFLLNASASLEAETGTSIIMIEAQGLDPSFIGHTYGTTLRVRERVAEEKYDLIAVYLNPIQVVKTGYDYLVMGKNTVFEVGIYSSFPSTVFAAIKLGFENFDIGEYVTHPLPLKSRQTTYYILPLNDDLPTEYWLRFELRKAPKPIGKPVEVYVEVDPDNRIEELDDVFNNRLDDVFPVQDTEPLTILYRPAPIFPGDDWTSLLGMLDSFATLSTEFILGTYPIADKEIKCFVDRTWAPTTIRVPSEFYEDVLRGYFPSNVQGLVAEENDEVVLDLGVAAQNGLITATRNASDWVVYLMLRPFSFAAYQSAADQDCFYRIVVVTPQGWFDRNLHASWTGTGGVTWHSMHGAVLAEVGRINVPAHEIGHSFFLWTNGTEEYNIANPGLKAFGFWVNEYREIDDDCRHDLQWDHDAHPGFCFMGFALDPSNTPFRGNDHCWICNHDYERLQDTYAPFDPELLLVDGIVFKNGNVIIHPFHRFPSGVTSMRLGTKGNYYIILLSSAGETLGQVGFNATFKILDRSPTGPSLNTDFEPFMFTIPWIEGVTEIQIQDKDGNVLASRNTSLNTPQVVINTPHGGEIFYTDSTCRIEWSATDQDGDRLTFNILYSPDNGEAWSPLTMDFTGDQLNWDLTDVTPGEEYLIRIVASDGVNSAEITTDTTFTVAERPLPSPMIPGFPLEAVLLGVLVTSAALVYMRKKQTIK